MLSPASCVFSLSFLTERTVDLGYVTGHTNSLIGANVLAVEEFEAIHALVWCKLGCFGAQDVLAIDFEHIKDTASSLDASATFSMFLLPWYPISSAHEIGQFKPC